MSIVWPIELPQDLLQDGYSDTYQDNTVRFKPDAGPAHVRRRYTAVPREAGGRQIMTKAQTLTLDAFYLDTLQGGALSFEWRHPRTGETASLRFLAPPVFAPAGGIYWSVDMRFEVLP